MRISDWSSDVCSSDLEGAVVGAGAGRSARAAAGDVDLVDLVEPAGCVTGQQAGVAGREPRADDDGHPPLGGFGAAVEEALDVVEPVGARHHAPTLRPLLTGLVPACAPRPDRQDGVGATPP